MANANPFTIAEARFIDAKFYFWLVMMEELLSPSNHQEEGKFESKSLKENKSFTNK
jgi:hypothetical protein